MKQISDDDLTALREALAQGDLAQARLILDRVAPPEVLTLDGEPLTIDGEEITLP